MPEQPQVVPFPYDENGMVEEDKLKLLRRSMENSWVPLNLGVAHLDSAHQWVLDSDHPFLKKLSLSFGWFL